MCWLCNNPMATFDDYLEEVVRPTVDLYGFAVQAMERDGAQLAYTVGLAAQGRDELLVTGKPPDDAHDLLQAVLAAEEEPQPGERCDLLVGTALWAFRVLRPETLVVATELTPGAQALQLVWADARGRWPWQVHRSAQRLYCDVRAARAA